MLKKVGMGLWLDILNNRKDIDENNSKIINLLANFLLLEEIVWEFYYYPIFIQGL